MSENLSRRRYVAGTGAVLTVGALAGCADDEPEETEDPDDTNGADTDVPPAIDDYLDGAQLYDGTIEDHTGEDEVVVDVGGGDIGFAYDPPAIRIDSGTTVRWEWTGEGGAHNVRSVAESDSDFDSGEAVDDAGETFEQSFDDDGIQLYECTPHVANGMLGGIEVVD
ncbi:MAG: halocyanin domain-containing protein [Halorubrum sp.]